MNTESELVKNESPASAEASSKASAKASAKARAHRPTRWQLLHASPWMRGVRLASFAAVLVAIGLFATFSHVRGQIGEQMLDVGENLMRYERSDRQDDTRELRVNGQSLMVTSGTSPDDLEIVLDEFERRCRAHNAALQAEVRRLNPQEFFVLRRERGGSGAVGCIDFGGEISTAELYQRATRFKESNDLQDLGTLRYVYARTLSEGRGVHFLTFWTTGSLDFDEITGHRGTADVPGTDVEGVPRPPRARRILDASETGVNQHIVSYGGSSMTSWELEAYYREALPQNGFRLIDTRVTPGASTEAPAEDTTSGRILLSAERGERMTFLVLDNDRRGLGIASVLTTD